MRALCLRPTQLQVTGEPGRRASTLWLPSLVLLLGAAADSVAQPTFFAWIQMTEYCRISCYLVNYSLGLLILCWESCTHLALKVHIARDIPCPRRTFSSMWPWATSVSQQQPTCTWSLSLPLWPFQQAGSISKFINHFILYLWLIPQPERDGYCLTPSPVKLSISPHHLSLFLLQRRAELK